MYFGNKTAAVTTCLLAGLVAYMAWLIRRRAAIQAWGRHTLALFFLGLFICCMAATRDGLHLTVQNAIDGSCAPGLFPLVSFPTIAGVTGAAVIVLAGLVTLFFREQRVRESLCFVMMGGFAWKIIAIELCRLLGGRG